MNTLHQIEVFKALQRASDWQAQVLNLQDFAAVQQIEQQLKTLYEQHQHTPILIAPLTTIRNAIAVYRARLQTTPTMQQTTELQTRVEQLAQQLLQSQQHNLQLQAQQQQTAQQKEQLERQWQQELALLAHQMQQKQAQSQQLTARLLDMTQQSQRYASEIAQQASALSAATNECTELKQQLAMSVEQIKQLDAQLLSVVVPETELAPWHASKQTLQAKLLHWQTAYEQECQQNHDQLLLHENKIPNSCVSPLLAPSQVDRSRRCSLAITELRLKLDQQLKQLQQQQDRSQTVEVEMEEYSLQESIANLQIEWEITQQSLQELTLCLATNDENRPYLQSQQQEMEQALQSIVTELEYLQSKLQDLITKNEPSIS